MRRAVAAVVISSFAAAGCAESGPEEITVFAAASLTDAFMELGRSFEAEHPNYRVTFNFGASSTLALQIRDGAEADVFAAADEVSMRAVGTAGRPRRFATNRLAIAVGPGNPSKISSLADLASDGLIVVLCASRVPCGRYADSALDKAGVDLEPTSREDNVRAVLTKVRLGEADAGIVYASDVTAADGDVEGIEIPEPHDVVASYPIAVLRSASDREGAEAFVDHVRSDAGARVLARHGFLP